MAAPYWNGLMIGIMVIAIFLASYSSADPDLLQHVCGADLSSGVKLNGFSCKSKISADYSFFAGLAKPASTNNPFGATVTAASVTQINGLNTLGVSMARIDYAPGGSNPPRTHPRATEIVFVLEGKLDVSYLCNCVCLQPWWISDLLLSRTPNSRSEPNRFFYQS